MRVWFLRLLRICGLAFPDCSNNLTVRRSHGLYSRLLACWLRNAGLNRLAKASIPFQGHMSRYRTDRRPSTCRFLFSWYCPTHGMSLVVIWSVYLRRNHLSLGPLFNTLPVSPQGLLPLVGVTRSGVYVVPFWYADARSRVTQVWWWMLGAVSPASQRSSPTRFLT